MFRKMSKSLLFIALIILALIASIINLFIFNGSHHKRSNTVEYSHEDAIEFSEFEAISCATHVIEATYVGEYKTKNGIEFIFKPVAEIKGVLDSADQALIYVLPRTRDSSVIVGEYDVPFRENDEYLLILEKHISVYYEHNVYIQIGRPIGSSDYSEWDKSYTYASEIASSNQNEAPSWYGVDFSHSTDLSSVVDFSSNIFVVNIDGIYAESTVAPTTVYYCSVQKTIRGMPVENGNILITFFNGDVEIGEEYLVLLADSTDTAPIYTLSAQKNSVFKMRDAEQIHVLSTLLENAFDYNTTERIIKSDQEVLEEEKVQ